MRPVASMPVAPAKGEMTVTTDSHEEDISFGCFYRQDSSAQRPNIFLQAHINETFMEKADEIFPCVCLL